MNALLLGGLLLLTQVQEQPSSGVNFFSLERDIQIGSELAKEADSVQPLVREGTITSYFREVGSRLARNSPLPGLNYRFRIVNSRQGNAVTFPGGYIYVDRELIELTVNEHELAAILAHEVAHAAARHATAQLSRQLLVLAPMSLAAVLPAQEGWKDELARLGISFGSKAPFWGYSIDQELEANTIAVQVLVKAGYSPYALSSILAKINASQASEKNVLPGYAFHHPQREEATLRLEADLEKQKVPEHPLKPSPAFRSFHSALIKLPAPVSDPVDQAINTILPNLYVHPENYYRLSYPDGWQVRPTGLSGAKIAPPGGIQPSRTGEDLRTGVMFDLFDFGNRDLSLEQATDRLIVSLREANQS